MTERPYDILRERLRDFISKYYLQRWLKGLLQVFLIFVSLYLITSTLEYNLYFSTNVRRVLFFTACLAFFTLSSYWILLPLIHYWQSTTRLNEKQAASIIGQYFPEVKDKLLNILFLDDMKAADGYSLELIHASIEQKSKSLSLVRFNDAIDWARNRKLAKFLLIPMILLLLIGLFLPNLLKDSTYRLMNYDKVFSPKAPFDFKLLNSNLKVQQFESLDILARLEGKTLPKELNIFYNGVHYPMRRDENGIFKTTLQNIEKSGVFRFESMGFFSDDYQIDMIPKPVIKEFEVTITPPSYTGLSSISQKNIGDIQAPEGSIAIWKFKTEYVDQIYIQVGGHRHQAEQYSNGAGLKLQLKYLDNYKILIGNRYSNRLDSQQYAVSLSPDAHPIISVNEFNDSIQDIRYYAGDVSDDHGVSALQLVIVYGGKTSRVPIAVGKSKNSNFQISTQDIFKRYPKGADIHYFFEVFDNDQIHGAKSTKSNAFHLKKLTEKELERVVDKNTAQIQSELSNSLKEAKQFQNDLESVKKKLIEKTSLDFADKKMLEELIKKQEELQKKLEDSKSEIQRNFDKKNELTPQEQNILDQQKQLEEMVEQMKNPELQDLLKKINDLLEKSTDKKELMQQLDQMDSRSEKMEKNIDRLLQLYKNLDYKQKLNDMIDKLDELGKEQKKLALESELNKNNLEQQKELSKQVDEAKKKMEELNKLNNDVNKTDKKEFEEVKKDLEEAGKEQGDAEKELGENDTKSGGNKQENAAKKLNEAKDKLQNLKKNQKKKQNAEDAKMMRRLLENVIYLSFEQERILERTKTINPQTPSYIKLIQDEQRLKTDFKLIEDTLYKIAARQVKLRKFIFEEVDKVSNNTQLAIQRLVERRTNIAISNEQYAMAAYNKLGLMMSESLKNMQEEENDNEDSNPSMCNNPGDGKKKKKGMSMSKLAEMQQQLNEQMEKLQQQMKEKSQQGKSGKPDKSGEPKESGQPQSGGKDGKGGKEGKEGKDGKESAEFAKIAAQQQAIRNALKKIDELSNSPDKSGKKPLGNGLQDAMDKMNQTEKDLVNKKFYDEMLKRQKEIQVKLLESAKAEREQDEENRRESERAKNVKPEVPSELKRYLENKKQNESQINKTPVGLTPYFKSLSEKYFELIK